MGLKFHDPQVSPQTKAVMYIRFLFGRLLLFEEAQQLIEGGRGQEPGLLWLASHQRLHTKK